MIIRLLSGEDRITPFPEGKLDRIYRIDRMESGELFTEHLRRRGLPVLVFAFALHSIRTLSQSFAILLILLILSNFPVPQERTGSAR